ncbi:hypothetical protein [Salinactinospora qingdaonensis]|uniref:Glycosyl hydrolase family 31 C-terminal domain-containing protein n=1 Tax=Salinactinospora qingdaonensis TaxID=702744 RepID=A0ABP7F501_9ACTN
MDEASRSGLAPMRPLFVAHPHDPLAWEVEDQFLLGADVLVAPVLSAGCRSRAVYLPAGRTWGEAGTGARHADGAWVQAPLR